MLIIFFSAFLRLSTKLDIVIGGYTITLPINFKYLTFKRKIQGKDWEWRLHSAAVLASNFSDIVTPGNIHSDMYYVYYLPVRFWIFRSSSKAKFLVTFRKCILTSLFCNYLKINC